MLGIEYLEREHEEITQVINAVESKCIEIMNGKEINQEYFADVIEFIRVYADDTHHKKEEDILFRLMTENLGETAEKLIRSGMLTEHQMARYYVMELERNLAEYAENPNDVNKIQIIANAMSYVNLLRVHIEKENEVVYPFGANNLSKEVLSMFNEEMAEKIELEKGIIIGKEELIRKLI